MRDKKQNILFLNGWMENIDSWSQVIGDLERDYNCFTLEFPGFGVESIPSEIWSIKDYSIWVSDQISKLGLNNVIVAGHSFGGRVAIVLSTLDSRIEKLILYGTPGFKEPQSKRISLLISANNLALKMGINREKLPFARVIKNKISSQDYKNAGEMSEIFKQAINFDLIPYMGKVGVPTLILIGDTDEQVSISTALEMQKTIKASRLKIMPKTGHFAHIDNPNLFCGIIRKFADEKNI